MKRLGLARGLAALRGDGDHRRRLQLDARGVAAAAQRQVHDRLLERRAARQWLARGDALLDQGPGRRPGNVAKLKIIHRNTDAAGQLEDIRNLIAQGVNAIIVNPADPDALNPALEEATDGRHRRRRRRRLGHRAGRLHPVQRPGAVRLPRRQVAVRADRRQGRRRLHARRRRRTRPTPTATRASRRRSPRIPGIKVAKRTRSPAGSRPGHPADQRLHRAAARSSTASGRRASTTSSSTRSRRPTIRSCRSSAPTMPASSASSSPSRACRAPPSPTPARSAAPA